VGRKTKKKVDARRDLDPDEESGEGKRTTKKPDQISGGGKGAGDLEDWATGRLGGNREQARRFMDWIKTGHRKGLPHDHLAPGSPEAEAALNEWIAEGRPER
jgi:hypothetical protein